ncbi:MAG: YkoF family thiamine/hydroxymethylpyrimidine-binding protein [Pseudomonadota bacterium]
MSMTLTAELSLYPLREDYVAVILEFIEGLKPHAEITVKTNAMSTQLVGPHDKVMSAVSETLKLSAERFGMQVLVCKFIAAELEI